MRAAAVGLLLAALCIAGAAAELLANDFDFFVNGAHDHCWNGDCSFPGAWWRANQTAYPVLTDGHRNPVLKIAVSDYYPKGPTLYFRPGAWCDMEGAVADARNLGLNPRPSRRRSLLSALATGARGGGGADPPGPPKVVVNSGTGCWLLPEDGVAYKVGKDATPQAAERALGGAYKIALPANLPDGETCIDVTAVYSTSRVATTPDYKQYYEPLGDVTSFTRTVCLHKLTKQADASLTFDMCSNNKFTLRISDLTPLPVNVTRWGAPTPHNLFRPLVKIWGRKVSELDGTPSRRGYDRAAAARDGGTNYVARFFPVPASYSGGPLAFPLPDGLQEGFYDMSAVVSVVTAYPALTNLTGLNPIAQDDEAGQAAGVTGLWEAASRMVLNGTVVGVQRGTTPTTLSSISSPSHAAGKAVGSGDKIVLKWTFRGAGTAACEHDGEPISNAPAGACVSPLTLTAKDVGATDARHTVRVTFTDVCGRARSAEFEYAQAGVRALTAVEAVGRDGGAHSGGGAGIKAAAAGAAGAAALVAAVLL